MKWKGVKVWHFGLGGCLGFLIVVSVLTTLGRKTRNIFVNVNTSMTSTGGDEWTPSEPGVATEEARGGPSGQPSRGKAFAATAPAKTARKVVMTGSVTLEVKRFEKVHAEVVKVAKDLGGYVANSELNLPSEGAQSGMVTIRVPQEGYDEALSRLKKLGKLVNENQSAEDVTQKYVDLDARVRNLKAEEERILDMMKRARTIKETLQVDQRLTELREHIEVIEGQFRYLKFQIAMATITVTLTEKATALHLPEPKWVWLNVVQSAWHSVVIVAQGLATLVTYLVLYGIFWVPVVALFLVAKRVQRKRSGHQ